MIMARLLAVIIYKKRGVNKTKSKEPRENAKSAQQQKRDWRFKSE